MTLGSAGMVLYEKQSKSKGMEFRWGLLTEIVLIGAAFISLAGTVGAIYFGNMVSHLKDIDSQIQIADAKAKAQQSLAEGIKNQLALEQLKPTISTLQNNQKETATTVHAIIAARKLTVNNAMMTSIDKYHGAIIRIQADESDSDSMSLYSQLFKLFSSYSPQPNFVAVLGMPPVSPFIDPGIHILYEKTAKATGIAKTLGSMLSGSKIPSNSSVPSSDKIRELESGGQWPKGGDAVLVIVCRRN